MAQGNFQHYMSDYAIVQFDAEDMGINRGEIPINVQPKFLDVSTDQAGGPEGVPADSQFMGAIAIIQCALTRYDLKAIEKMLRMVPIISTAYEYGQFPAIGTFVRQQGMARVLQLTTANETRQFDVAFIRQPYELNVSKRFRTYMITFEAWMDAATYQQLYYMRNQADDGNQTIDPGDNAPNHGNYSNTALS